jgi:hypothetical protein
MTERPPGTTILVPIDYQGVSPATLDMLVHIAGQLNRRLLGLVLEGSRLQRVAELPFATEILLGSGQERRLERDHLSRRSSLVAADTRRRLLELAQQARIELSFEDDHGDRWHAALTRGGTLDIFIPPRQRWHRPATSNSPARSLIPRLGILLAAGAADARTVATALALEQAGLVGRAYLLSARRPDPAMVASLLHGRAPSVLQQGVATDPASLLSLLRRSPYDLLLVHREALTAIPADQLEAALEDAGGQVMVVA